MRLTTKYPLTIVSVALAAMMVTGVVAYQKSKMELRRAAERQSMEILESRKAALGRYLRSIRQDVALMASNRYVQDALAQFTGAWPLLEGDPGETLRRLYIHGNPHPVGEKEDLNQAEDGSAYSAIHGRYHPWFRQFQKDHGYYDIFLFDTDGNLVYTVFKELDFATNLVTGRWKDTDLSRAFRTAAFNNYRGFQAFFDFKRYGPSNGVPASFISAPVFDDEEAFIGVLAFQMPVGRINEIMQVSAGMGKTGRAYVVGSDSLVRNDSRFSTGSEILNTKKPPEIVKMAMEGLTGSQIIADTNGKQLLATFTPIGFADQTWAIIAEIEMAEILAPVRELRQFLILAGLIIAAVVAVVGVLLAARLSRPIVAMTGVMQRLADRDLSVEIPEPDGDDEIGDMAKTLAVFKETAAERQMAESALHESKARLSAAIEAIADGFIMTNAEDRIVLFNSKFRNLYPNSFDLIAIGSTYENFLRGGAERGEFSDAIDRVDEWVGEQLAERRKNLSVVEISVIGERWVRVASRALPTGGRVDLHVDFTEIKKAYQRLARMNDELTELNEIKNKFMAMAAHDLRSPIGAIRGMSELIMSIDLGRKKEREIITSINAVSDQMLDLLNDLLDVSVIESGHFDLNLTLESLAELVETRVDLVSLNAKTKEIRIETDFDDVPAIAIDAARINQVVDNLLTNAVKFSPPESVVEVSVRTGASALSVAVRDHGQGIPPHEIGKLFSAFEKLSSKPTAGEKGTGLGLAIVKKIVEAHDGEITVDSTPGEGATFTVLLPKEVSQDDAFIGRR